MNRGRRAEAIFDDSADYEQFVELLKESSGLWNVRIGAYCLMRNHYHLLIQTPLGNLSRCMRHINGVYTQRFNSKHGVDGQLFRGRYKAIVVDADSYLLELTRYIHNNPVKAGIVESAQKYEWSSHQGYLSRAKKWDWLYKDAVLSLLSKEESRQRKAYRRYMGQEEATEIEKIYSKKKLPTILGDEGFIELLKEEFFGKKRHGDVPESRYLAPETAKIRAVVSKAYGVSEAQLKKSRRGRENEGRNVAIYLTRQLRAERLVVICEAYGLRKESSVSSVIEKVRDRLKRDKGFEKRVAELEQLLIKS